MCKISLVILILALALASSPAHAKPENGELRDDRGLLQVWSDKGNQWLDPENFFRIELDHLNGPTYGSVKTYPAYESVKEWESLIDILPDGRTCPMVFFHSRWRRLPDVLALDERLRNFGGCKDVFD